MGDKNSRLFYEEIKFSNVVSYTISPIVQTSPVISVKRTPAVHTPLVRTYKLIDRKPRVVSPLIRTIYVHLSHAISVICGVRVEDAEIYYDEID